MHTITDIKEIAKRVRIDLAYTMKKGELPAMKVSVRVRRFAGGQSLDVYVTHVPEAFAFLNAERVRWEAENPRAIPAFDAPEAAKNEFTDQGTKALKTIERIVSAYNWDNSDHMTDYFDVNFYQHVGYHWELEEAHRRSILAASPTM